METLVLGSTSPRRKEILNFFKIPFIQTNPHFDEDDAPILNDPAAYAHSLSLGKMHSLIPRYKDSLILTADTVVYKEGVFFSKPRDEAELKTFMRAFSGSYHTVITSLTLYHKGAVFQGHEETKVLFNKLTDAEVEKFAKVDGWRDKAGGYGIQGASSLLVKKIEGSFYNVMGLPIHALTDLLLHADIDLWDYI